MPRFYTTGCSGQDVADLKSLLESLSAVLVDIRFQAESELLIWREVYLKVLLREKYYHLPQLGARSFRGNKMMIQNLELGIRTLLALKKNALLLCSCPTLADCHRRAVSDYLKGKGYEVEEIGSWAGHRK